MRAESDSKGPETAEPIEGLSTSNTFGPTAANPILGVVKLERAVELALKFARVRLMVAPARSGRRPIAGALQELLECQGEHGVTIIDGVLPSRVGWAR
jgi:hypothetical protein